MKLTQKQVQQTLDTIGFYKEFTVVFTKVDGTERSITGFMEEPKSPPKNTTAVPVKVSQGDAAGQWRSFRLDSVVALEVNNG